MTVTKTEQYQRRIDAVDDERAKARIASRVLRLCGGNPGDAEPVGEGVSELRIHYGPGYRVYYKQRGDELIILLLAGSKKSQRADIALAKKIASNL